MTAKDFIARLAPVDHERLARIFKFLADNTHELTLETGQRLRDELDFGAFLRELAAACKFSEAPATTPRPLRDNTCPECGHEHEDKTECRHYLGEGRFCPCEAKVPA